MLLHRTQRAFYRERIRYHPRVPQEPFLTHHIYTLRHRVYSRTTSTRMLQADRPPLRHCRSVATAIGEHDAREGLITST